MEVQFQPSCTIISRQMNWPLKAALLLFLNEGRQILFGNVGYRVLQANIEELIKNPEVEASWC